MSEWFKSLPNKKDGDQTFIKCTFENGKVEYGTGTYCKELDIWFYKPIIKPPETEG